MPSVRMATMASAPGTFSGPAVVPRGRAPAAAFDIPPEGATVPKGLSFLERYLAAKGALVPQPPASDRAKRTLPAKKEQVEDESSSSSPVKFLQRIFGASKPAAPSPPTPQLPEPASPKSPSTSQEGAAARAAAVNGEAKSPEPVQTEHVEAEACKRQEPSTVEPAKNEPEKEVEPVKVEPKEETDVVEAVKAEPREEEPKTFEPVEVVESIEPVKSEPAPAASSYAKPADANGKEPEKDTEPEPARLSFPALRLCSSTALADRDALAPLGIPLGFVWSPFGPLSNVPRSSGEANRCGTCGSFLAAGNGAGAVLAGAKTWTCSFCGRSDNPVTGSIGPGLVSDAVDYTVRSPAAHPVPARQAMVVVLDERLQASEAAWARAAVRSVLESAKAHGCMFALVTYGSGVSVADFGSSDGAAALDVLSMTRAARLPASAKRRYFREAGAAGASDERVASVVDRCVAADEASAMDDELPRRLDAALTVTLELLADVVDTENSRVLALLSRAPTLEPPAGGGAGVRDSALGARFEALGTRAGDMRLALDFLCFGSTDSYAAGAILGAARRSRGGVVLSGAHGFVGGADLAAASKFLAERSTRPGVVSIRVSAPLAVSRVIGPAFPTAAPHTYAVPGVDPTAGFTVILALHEGAGEAETLPSHVVIQLAAKSALVTRVITVRVPVTKDRTVFLDSVNAETSAVVLGKACIVSNGGLTQPLVAARAVDAGVAALLQADVKCISVARLLFELRRGFMLERYGHSDSGLVQRALFLRLEGTTASLLLSPRLFTNAVADEDTGLMAEVPLDVASVRPDAVMVLDAGVNLFVLVGADADAEAEKAVSKSAARVAKHRSFPCQLWRLKQGEESAKLMESYLVKAQDKRGGLQLPMLRAPRAVGEITFYGYCRMLAPGSAAVKLLAESSS